MFMNMTAAVVLRSSDALVGVMMRFISLKPPSHSALLAGSECKQRNSGFSSFGIFLPPLSVKSRKLSHRRCCKSELSAQICNLLFAVLCHVNAIITVGPNIWIKYFEFIDKFHVIIW